MSQIESPRVVSKEEWFRARKAHLKNEKALTRMRDLVARERRELPWVKLEKEYVFDTLEGKKIWHKQSIGHSPFHVRP